MQKSSPNVTVILLLEGAKGQVALQPSARHRKLHPVLPYSVSVAHRTLNWNLPYSSSEDVEDVEEAGILLNQFSLAPWTEEAGVPCNGVVLRYMIKKRSHLYINCSNPI